MLNFLLTKFAELGEWYCHTRGKELHIGGTLQKDDIYMVRYPFFVSKCLTVYIHRFLRSDGEDHHDHPFSFWSYVATGGYDEELLEPVDFPTHASVKFDLISGPFHVISKRRKAGSLAYRPGGAIHRVLVDQELKYKDRKQGPLTIVVFGKRFRTWGFWPKWNPSSTPGCTSGFKYFVPWHEYLGIDPNSEKAKKHQ